MTSNDIRTRLEITDTGDVLLERTAGGGTITVGVDGLSALFPGVPPSEGALLAHDAANGLGYEKYIRRWRSEGRIDA